MSRRASHALRQDHTWAVADRLHSAAIHLLRRLRRQDLTTGIGPARLSALSVVVFAGPLTLGELAAAEQVKPPTMTRIVAALERGGYLRRTPDPRDRRIVRVHATPQGTRVLQQGRRRRIAFLVEHLHHLAPGEIAALGQAAELIERLLRTQR